MTSPDTLRAELDRLYQMIDEHPNMLVHPTMIEGFISGLEIYCHAISPELIKDGGFGKFKFGDIWSSECFATAFMRRHKCILGWIPFSRKASVDISRNLQREYFCEFDTAWKMYLHSLRD